MNIRILPILSVIFILSGCETDQRGPAPIPDNYTEQHEIWKADRLESLTNPAGWMRLSGMFWLEEGENHFGSGADQTIRFPAGTIPEHAGIFFLDDGIVTMKTAGGVTITHEGDPVNEMVIFDGEDAPRLQHKNLEWLVIERNGLTGIRLYNKENAKVDAFTGFNSYPLDTSWVLKARYIPNPDDATIPIVNILGQAEEVPSPGKLEFVVDGNTYTLDALKGSTRMFIIVGDATNGTETYQAGRYMYIDYPEEGSDYTVIDFNKAYNPPCAYSTFTTCQLPPPQNRLSLSITAGEKKPVGWSGNI